MSFVPLHVYSGFSYLQSALKAQYLPALAKKYGYEAIAICDHGSMSGYAPFTHIAKEQNIKPIYGMDVMIGGDTFSLFVKNEEGYRNLLPLTLRCSQEKITIEDLKKHSAGLILVFLPDP